MHMPQICAVSVSNLSLNVSAPFSPSTPPAAELHHGHGGEDAALADGAAPMPGGRPRGAQLLDPAVQRRGGAEEGRGERAVEAAEPSGAGKRTIRLAVTPSARWCCFALKCIFEHCYFNPSSVCSDLFARDRHYVFVCPQKFTGSFCTGLCLDMFLKKSGRKLVSLRSSQTHKHIRTSAFVRTFVGKNAMSPKPIGSKNLLAKSPNVI